jgi:hypothetical protein
MQESPPAVWLLMPSKSVQAGNQKEVLFQNRAEF